MPKDGYSIVMLDRCDWRRLFKLIGDKDCIEYILEQLCKRYEFGVDAESILPAQAVKLSTMKNMSNVICDAKPRSKKHCRVCWTPPECLSSIIVYASLSCV